MAAVAGRGPAGASGLRWAWEQSLLTWAGKVLAAWGGKDSQDENAPDTLRKAIAEGDWETIEQHGG